MMNTGNLSGGYSILSAGSVLPTKDMTEFLVKSRKGEVLDPPRLNYHTRIDMRKDEYKEALAGLLYQGDDRIGEGELDVRKLEYAYSWIRFCAGC